MVSLTNVMLEQRSFLQMAPVLIILDPVEQEHVCCYRVPVMLKQPVNSRASILLGELVAIKMALHYILRCKTRREENISACFFRQPECCRPVNIRVDYRSGSILRDKKFGREKCHSGIVLVT